MKKELGCPFTLGEYEEMNKMIKTCPGNCGCNGKCGGNCKCSAKLEKVEVCNTAVNTLDLLSLTIDQQKIVADCASACGYDVKDVELEFPFTSVVGSGDVSLPNITMRLPKGDLIGLPIRVEDII